MRSNVPNKPKVLKKTSKDQKSATKSGEGTWLNKYLANSGVAARRKCEDFIEKGFVTVNGKTVKEKVFKVMPGDIVTFKGKKVSPEQKIYLLLNKPKDYITTNKDERGRKKVMDLVKDATTERIYPVGRLDRNTTGLLLMTNDGELAQLLAHPSSAVPKVYAVTLNKPLQEEDFYQIKRGILLEDGDIKVDEVAFIDDKDHRQIGMQIHSGRNRIVRRIFEHLGYKVMRLDRTLYANLTKKGLSRGHWRHLQSKEIALLKQIRNAK